VPKPSSEAWLLGAKDGTQRRLVEIPLSEDERAAVGSDEHSVVRLIDLLAEVATPAGPTPREMGALAPVSDPSDATEPPSPAHVHDRCDDPQPRRTRLLTPQSACRAANRKRRITGSDETIAA
jgi:hypothetical protein